MIPARLFRWFHILVQRPLAEGQGHPRNAAHAWIGILFVVAWFSPVIVGGRILLPADLLFYVDPAFASVASTELPPHPSNFLAGWDRVFQFHPWLAYNIRTIAAGELPLINPFAAAGSPHFALAQPAVLDPLSTGIGMLVGPERAGSARAVMSALVAVLGMLTFARARGLTPLAACVAALAFAFGGWFTLWLGRPMTAAAAWIPWMLWGAHRTLTHSGRSLHAIVLALFVALAWFAGHPATVAHGLLLTVIFALWAAKQGSPDLNQPNIPPSTLEPPPLNPTRAWNRTRRVTKLLLALGAGTALAGVLLVPFGDFLFSASGGSAARAESSLSLLQRLMTGVTGDATWSRVLSTLLTAVIPAFNPTGLLPYSWPAPNLLENTVYVGAASVFLIAIAWRSCTKEARFWIFLGLGSLAVALHLPMAELLGQLPLVRWTSVDRLRMVWAISAAMAAGHGVAALQRTPGDAPPLLQKRMATLGTLGAALGALFVMQFLSDASTDAQIRAIAGLAALTVVWSLAAWISPRALGKAASAVLALELFATMHGVQPSVPQQAVFPETPVVEFLREGNRRIMSLPMGGRLPLFGAVPTYFGIESVEAYSVLHPSRLEDLYRAVNSGAPPSGLSADFLVLEDPDHPVVDLLGVGYLIAPAVPPERMAARASLQDFRAVWSDGHVVVFENHRAMPRAFVSSAVVTAADRADALARVADVGFEPRDAVVVERDIGLGDSMDRVTAPVPASIRRMTPNRLQVDVDADAPGILVVTDAFVPGWRARVGGVETHVIPADYAFLGIPVPAGSHTVELWYAPRSFILGLILSGVTLAGLAAAFLLELLSRRRNRLDLGPTEHATGDT